MTHIPYDPAAPDSEARLREARSAVGRLPRERTQLLPAFLAAQDALGWLPREAVEHVSEHTRVPIAEVYATATAYSELRLEPPVPGTWCVCTGVACGLAGAEALLEAIPDRTRPIDCQFLCALAPVVHDDAERLYGRVTPQDLRERVEQPS